MSLLSRAQDAISEGYERGGRGRRPNGERPGIQTNFRLDPNLVIEMDELTDLKPGELIRLAVFVARSAKNGATDADLAMRVRAWLKRSAE